MLSWARIGRWAEHLHCCIFVLLLIGGVSLSLPREAWSAAVPATQPAVLELEGKVGVSRGNSGIWNPAQTNQIVQPGDWVEVQAEMSVASFRVTKGDQSAQVTVTPLPGRAGGVLENVKRWRTRFERRSPVNTTNWRDLPVVRASS